MKIVVGYDGSEHADRAVEQATQLLGDEGELLVVAAAETHGKSGVWEFGAHLDMSEVEQRRRELESLKRRLTERGIQVETREVQGDPGAAVVREADSAGADLIVVGSRGRSPIQRILLGSVSAKVVNRAHCNVLVVR